MVTTGFASNASAAIILIVMTSPIVARELLFALFEEMRTVERSGKDLSNFTVEASVVFVTAIPALPAMMQSLGEDYGVEVFADDDAYKALEGHYAARLNHASDEHFGTEFLSLRMSVKTVSGLDEALDHIHRFSSKHSEAIVAENPEVIERFLNCVDAAAVYANTSTAFTDGAQFGMGAEIGISTQKLHARGPMALPELTSYKWVVRGSGQVRT